MDKELKKIYSGDVNDLLQSNVPGAIKAVVEIELMVDSDVSFFEGDIDEIIELLEELKEICTVDRIIVSSEHQQSYNDSKYVFYGYRDETDEEFELRQKYEKNKREQEKFKQETAAQIEYEKDKEEYERLKKKLEEYVTKNG